MAQAQIDAYAELPREDKNDDLLESLVEREQHPFGGARPANFGVTLSYQVCARKTKNSRAVETNPFVAPPRQP
jgi:hypothetical protein